MSKLLIRQQKSSGKVLTNMYNLMYNKPMKNLGSGIVILFLGLNIYCPAQASFLGNIPSATMQIAREAGLNDYVTTPVSKLVRVGIGTNNFSSYEWSEASIYGTGEFEVFNNKTYINTYDANDEVKINMVGKIFVLTNSEGEVIEKVSGPIVFKTDFGYMGVKNLKRAGQDAIYRGQLKLVCAKEGKFHIVNELELEDYLKGVVPNEMPVSFGLEALKAQAVAARNYVLSPRVKANNNYDVVDSVASQVYFGANTEKELGSRAVQETTGVVALYGWDMILAQYSSTAGGYTESYSNAFSDPITKQFPSAPKPYLTAKPDNEEFEPLNEEEKAQEFYKKKHKSYDIKSPYYRWEREWNGQEIQDAVQANIAAQSATGFVFPTVKKGETIGIINKLKVTRRGESGKIMEMVIETDSGNYTVQKELVIRRLLTKDGKALPSANAVFEHEYNEQGELIYIKAYGGGFGHGVGLSQYGAGYMGSELHKSFDEILKHYYSGIVLATEPAILSSGNNNITKTFYSKYGRASLVVDNKYRVNCIELNINGSDSKVELDTKERYNIIDLSEYLRNGMNTLKFYYPENKGGIRFYIEIK